MGGSLRYGPFWMYGKMLSSVLICLLERRSYMKDGCPNSMLLDAVVPNFSVLMCFWFLLPVLWENITLHAACWLSISQCINFMVFRINKWSMPSLCATHFTAFVRTICFPINPISLCSPLGPLLEFPAECLLLNGCECCGRCLEYCPLDE